MWKMEGKRNCDHIGSSLKAMKSPWMLDIKMVFFYFMFVWSFVVILKEKHNPNLHIPKSNVSQAHCLYQQQSSLGINWHEEYV